ncbi:MAG: CoA transferase [Euzebyaceae bacterium]|nr:CoA transferase [Euzebyaceae bacterium]MDQ3710433.1 CoA transferase [Actinomycetota bacterium]
MQDAGEPLADDGAGAETDLPLEGVRVLDLTQALAGPYCTLLLADLGADVVKVEAPGRGDDSRHWGPPFVGDQAAYFLSVNRNKRSVALNLKSDGGAAAAQAIVASSDVVVENFRPGSAARLGLGAEALRARDQRLVYCSISGFGQDGPPRAGYDQIVQGMGGLMSLTGQPGGPPTKFGVPMADISAGMFASTAILAALYARERTGRGRTIDVAMHDAVIALLTYQAGRFFATGQAPGPQGNLHPTIAPYAMFASADGHVNVCVGNDAQFRRFCEALDAGDLADDERFATNQSRLAHRDELDAAIIPLLQALSTDEILERMGQAGVPCGPIRGLDEVFADPAVQDRHMQLRVNHPVLGELSLTGAPWQLDGHAVEARLPPPGLGEHTEAVLREVGYPPEQIEQLASTGDIALAPTTA